jgi:ribosomal protein S18 acetylase RimI-like enzyme
MIAAVRRRLPPEMEDSTSRFRRAESHDVPAIVRLLADDPLGSTRETANGDPFPDAYWRAFQAIDADPHQLLVVAAAGGQVVGTLQLTFIPSLTYTGGKRAQIEGVRVDASHRGRGLGREMVLWAIERARARGCRMVQLTTDQRRPKAVRFYQSLGFRPTHVGMKLPLSE